MSMKTENEDVSIGRDLPSQVKKWVEEQGYALEMRVAKVFRDNGFDVSQFDHFIDQESQDVRPVDVVATLSKDIGSSRVAIRLFVECKYSAKDKPWVIIVTSDRFDKFAFFSRILKGQHPSSWSKIETLQGRLVGRVIQAIDANLGLSAFSIKNPGYVVAESFTTQKDHAYEAIVQISKCVEAHDVETEEIHRKTTQILDDSESNYPSSELGLFFSVAIPIVVINGQLFESCLGNRNEVEASEIQSGMVFVPFRRHETSPHSRVVLSPVTVVTEKHMDSFVASIKRGMESILDQTEAIEAVIEHEQLLNARPSSEISIFGYREKPEDTRSK